MSRNEVSGFVEGPSIQAGHIHGGVHVHAAVPTATTPHQLPGPIPGFVGRRTELAAMETAGPVIVLSGAGGAGKTALVRDWAHRAAGTFAHGQLFLGLNGFGPGPPLHPAEALRSFLRALGIPAAELPSSLADLTALYRTRTADLSILVILDDVYSAAQARVLLPASPSSKAVITSRRHLAGLLADGATIIEVAPLNTGDSVALLTSALGRTRVEREQPQAVRLADLCAGLPLALSVAAARLSTRPRLTIAGVVAALADETDRLIRLETPDEEVSVRGSMELSYQALESDAAVLYRRLAQHPGPDFGAGPIAGLTADAVRLVDVLLEVNLLEEIAEDRYRLHDLVRLHALRKAADAYDDVLLTIVEWYLAAASAADRVVTPYRRQLDYEFRTTPSAVPDLGDREQALTWLDHERTNLAAAARAALDRQWAPLAWQLSDVVWPLQLYRKSVDRREFDERGLAAARLWGDPYAEARMLKRLGRTLTTLGEHDRAAELLTAAGTRFRDAGEVDERLEADWLLALTHRDAGRPKAAADLLRNVLAGFRERGSSRGAGLTLINLGDLSSGLGRHAEAIEFLREAGGLLEQSAAADPYNPVRVSTGLARAHLAAGDLPAAARASAAALDGMRRLGSSVGEAEALELAGVIAVRQGDVTLGRSHLRQALVILEAHGSPRVVALRARLADGDEGAVPEADGDAAGLAAGPGDDED